MLPITERMTSKKESKKERIDPRARRTRQLLIDAFQSLLMEKSFEEITVQDIAERATVNRATFYAHFADKYALGDDIMRESFRSMLEDRRAGNCADPNDYLRSLFLAVTDHWSALNERCRHDYRVFESLVESQVKGLLFDNICLWLAAHRPSESDASQQQQMIATIVSAAIYGAAMQWTRIRRTESAESYAVKAVPVIGASLLAA